MARRFEAGKVNPKTARIEPRPLKLDQALFITEFGQACNTVWGEEQKILDGSLEAKKRRTFNFLLLGQGGSGKTAIVQEIVLPAVDFIFPPEPPDTTSC